MILQLNDPSNFQFQKAYLQQYFFVLSFHTSSYINHLYEYFLLIHTFIYQNIDCKRLYLTKTIVVFRYQIILKKKCKYLLCFQKQVFNYEIYF